MNGTYDKIVSFLNKDQLKNVEELYFTNMEEFKFRVKNFYDKYSDLFINDIINQIKNCVLVDVYTQKTWVFEYRILAADIKIIDPINPDRSLIVIDKFFKKCFKILGATYKGFEVISQEENSLIFNVVIVNPCLDTVEKKLNSIILDSMID